MTEQLTQLEVWHTEPVRSRLFGLGEDMHSNDPTTRTDTELLLVGLKQAIERHSAWTLDDASNITPAEASDVDRLETAQHFERSLVENMPTVAGRKAGEARWTAKHSVFIGSNALQFRKPVNVAFNCVLVNNSTFTIG